MSFLVSYLLRNIRLIHRPVKLDHKCESTNKYLWPTESLNQPTSKAFSVLTFFTDR